MDGITCIPVGFSLNLLYDYENDQYEEYLYCQYFIALFSLFDLFMIFITEHTLNFMATKQYLLKNNSFFSIVGLVIGFGIGLILILELLNISLSNNYTLIIEIIVGVLIAIIIQRIALKNEKTNTQMLDEIKQLTSINTKNSVHVKKAVLNQLLNPLEIISNTLDKLGWIVYYGTKQTGGSFEDNSFEEISVILQEQSKIVLDSLDNWKLFLNSDDYEKIRNISNAITVQSNSTSGGDTRFQEHAIGELRKEIELWIKNFKHKFEDWEYISKLDFDIDQMQKKS